MTSPRLPRALLPAALLACGLLARPILASPQQEAARKEFLAAELELARSHQLYMVLEPRVPELDLKIDGVVLRRFPIHSARFGRSRLEPGGPAIWPGLAFTLVSEVAEPDRPRIQPPPPEEKQKEEEAAKQAASAAANPGQEASGTPPPAVATPSLADQISQEHEAMVAAVPITYRLRFDPELELVVRGEPKAQDTGSRLRRVAYFFREGWEGVARWLHDQPIPSRLVLYVTPDDARRIFQALLPQIHLLVAVPE